MLTQGESVEAHALRERGWSVSAIARHLQPGPEDGPGVPVRPAGAGAAKPAGPDRFGPFERYCRLRFEGDPHLWATALFEEVSGWATTGAYPSFTRALRRRGLRPSCEACAAAGTPAEFAVIDHPAGEETQWDWVELPDPPAVVGPGEARAPAGRGAVALGRLARGARGVARSSPTSSRPSTASASGWAG